MDSEFEKIKSDFETIYNQNINKNTYMYDAIEKFQISNNLFINIYFKSEIQQMIEKCNKKEESSAHVLKNNEYIVSNKIIKFKI